MIDSHLQTVRELEGDLRVLEADLSAFRAEYMEALRAGSHEALVRVSRAMSDKVGQIKAMLDRIQSYYSGAIPMAFEQGGRYAG